MIPMQMPDKECEEFLHDMRIILESMFVERARENIGIAATTNSEVLYDDMMSRFTALDYVLSKHFKDYERIASDKNLEDLKDAITQSEVADYLGGYRNIIKD